LPGDVEIFGLVSLIRLQIGKEAQKTLPFNSKTKHFYTTLVASGKSFKDRSYAVDGCFVGLAVSLVVSSSPSKKVETGKEAEPERLRHHPHPHPPNRASPN